MYPPPRSYPGVGHSDMDRLPPVEILQAALEGALRTLCIAPRPWLKVTGPAGVYVMVLARIGWLANSAGSITIHTGQTLYLTDISPKAVARLALTTTQHWADVQATAGRTSASPGFSIFWDALRPLLRGKMPEG